MTPELAELERKAQSQIPTTETDVDAFLADVDRFLEDSLARSERRRRRLDMRRKLVDRLFDAPRR